MRHFVCFSRYMIFITSPLSPPLSLLLFLSFRCLIFFSLSVFCCGRFFLCFVLSLVAAALLCCCVAAAGCCAAVAAGAALLRGCRCWCCVAALLRCCVAVAAGAGCCVAVPVGAGAAVVSRFEACFFRSFCSFSLSLRPVRVLVSWSSR